MPLVRIDVPSGTPATKRSAISTAVYDALRATLNVPDHDHFQVIAEHAPDALIIDATYLGIARGKDAILIQVTLNEGRTVEMKQAFYKAVADNIHASAGLRREDIVISLIEVKKENWSFGNGIAQYA